MRGGLRSNARARYAPKGKVGIADDVDPKGMAKRGEDGPNPTSGWRMKQGVEARAGSNR